MKSSPARCVAVVDGSADIDAAAKAITAARFSFGGRSPYAPDLVLVNEFAKKDFFEACSRYATLSFAGQGGVKRVSGNESDEIKKAIEEAEGKGQVSSFGSHEFKLVDVLDRCVSGQDLAGRLLSVLTRLRSTSIAQKKMTGRYLPITTYSSLTDAIYNHEFG